MKIRTGFVSNSSSTSFYLVFGGGKDELIKLINKYEQCFEIIDRCENDEIAVITKDHFIKALKRFNDMPEPLVATFPLFHADNFKELFDRIDARHHVQPISVLIEENKNTLTYIYEQLRWNEENNNECTYMERWEESLQEEQRMLEWAAIRDLTSYVELEAGNGGGDDEDFSPNIGSVIRSHKKELYIQKADFVVWPGED